MSPSHELASVGEKILHSSWWLGLQVVVDIGLAFVFAAITVRRLGPVGFGLVTLVQALLNVAGQGTLSLELALIRLVPEFRGQQDWAATRQVIALVLMVKLFLAGGLAIGLVVAAPMLAAFYRAPELLWAVRLGCLSLIAAAAAEVGAATCIALLHAEVLTMITATRRVGEVVGVLLMTTLSLGVPAVILVLGLADLVAAVGYGIAIANYLRRDPPSPKVRVALMPRILRYCLPIAGARFLDVLGREAGKLLLGRFVQPEILGYYGVARLMAERSMALLGQVTNAILPAITQLTSDVATPNRPPRWSIWNELVKRSFRYQWLISSGLVLGLWAIVPLALSLMGGVGYAPAVSATRILTLMIFLWSGTALANTLFFAHENTAGILGINALQLVGVVALYQLWVARWQLTGAVFADTVAQGLTFLLCLWLARRWFGFDAWAAIRIFLLSGLWVVVLVLPIGLTNYQGGWLIPWLVGGLGLVGSLFLLSGWPTPAEWRILAMMAQTLVWLNQFIQRAVYWLRRYQVFLRRSFKQLNHFGTGR